MSRRPPLARSAPAIAGLALLLTACAGGTPTGPATIAGPSTVTAAAPGRLPAGSYFLRSVDGRPLPYTLASGMRVEAGFVVSDSADAQLVGWGESIAGSDASSVRLATGTAVVLGEAVRADTRVAAITWRTAAATRDSVSWGRDTVVVHRTGAGPSLTGAGHRLVYTRATDAELR